MQQMNDKSNKNIVGSTDTTDNKNIKSSKCTINSMETFAQKVVKEVKKQIGRACQVSVQEVIKNNRVTLQGLVILSKKQNVSPTIYLEPFWESYQKGMPMEIIVEKIVTIYREDTPKNSIDMEFFKDFEKVKDRICYRLINKKENTELLQRIPHKEFLDLAICFYYAYQNQDLGDGTILLYNNHMEMWNTTVEELFSLAKENTPRLFEWECFDLQDMIGELLNEDGSECCTKDREVKIPMKVLCNKKRTHGAGVFLYEGMAQQMAEMMGGSYFILPSSIHEVILLKDSGHERKETLCDMIEEVNKTQVPPEEILSNSLYYYDSVEKSIKLV